MSQFARQLNNLEKLEKRTVEPSPQWWNDLLSLWRPSGVKVDEYGLRLAIRNGYLNFYRRGQSIARVEIDGNGTPTATTHFKYVCGDQDKSVGQEYVKLQGESILRDGKPWKDYRGIDDLKSWTAVVDEKYAGKEKIFVDQLVAANSNIIDLEMGLPAWGDKKSAPRMDLVAIEDHKVVFWEAKLVTDGRLRCRTDLEPDKKPKILKQLADYRSFLSAKGHAELVASAYQNAAKLMVTLRSMADQRGEAHPLGADILAAASGLVVDREPRLVIFDQADSGSSSSSSSQSWPHHEKNFGTRRSPWRSFNRRIRLP